MRGTSPGGLLKFLEQEEPREGSGAAATGKCSKSPSGLDLLKRHVLLKSFPQESSFLGERNAQWMLSCRSWI